MLLKSGMKTLPKITTAKYLVGSLFVVALMAWSPLQTPANAALITFNFQENGSNLDLGPVSTFTESGISLTASGFLTTGATTHLYAKNLGGDETGLGTTSDPSGQHEIVTSNFIQLTLPTTPLTTFVMVSLTSVQTGDQANVYFTTTPGTLTGATLIGTVTGHDGTVTIPAGDQTGFIDITAGAGNVLLGSATVSTGTVPDGGATVSLLGCALIGLAALRRKLIR
jgi:protein with PEP-CTERM/exosortase system signal